MISIGRSVAIENSSRPGGAWRIAMAVAMLFLPGCNKVSDKVRIGIAQPLSHGLSSLGQDVTNGARLAVEEINGDGGIRIDGHTVGLELVVADDEGEVATGDAAARLLIADDVEVAIADLDSEVSMHAAPLYAAAHVPQFSISTMPRFTALGLPTTLRLVANDRVEAQAIGTFAARLPRASRAAAVDDGSVSGRALANGAAAMASDGGLSVVLDRSLDGKTTEFSELVQQLVATRVDTIITTLSDFQVEALMQALVHAGLTDVVIVGGSTLETARTAQAPIPIRALYAVSPIIDAREFLAGGEFVRKYRARYHSDPFYAAHYAYDTVYLVADALQRNGNVDKDRLLQTLKSFDGNCPATESIRFGADGEQLYGAVGIYQVHGQAWELLMRSDRW